MSEDMNEGFEVVEILEAMKMEEEELAWDLIEGLDDYLLGDQASSSSARSLNTALRLNAALRSEPTIMAFGNPVWNLGSIDEAFAEWGHEEIRDIGASEADAIEFDLDLTSRASSVAILASKTAYNPTIPTIE